MPPLPDHLPEGMTRSQFIEIASAHAAGCTKRYPETAAGERDALEPDEAAFIMAAQSGNTTLLRDLITLGVDVDVVDTEMRRTALHWAVAKEQLGATRMLLDVCDAARRDAKGVTCFHSAAELFYAHNDPHSRELLMLVGGLLVANFDARQRPRSETTASVLNEDTSRFRGTPSLSVFDVLCAMRAARVGAIDVLRTLPLKEILPLSLFYERGARPYGPNSANLLLFAAQGGASVRQFVESQVSPAPVIVSGVSGGGDVLTDEEMLGLGDEGLGHVREQRRDQARRRAGMRMAGVRVACCDRGCRNRPGPPEWDRERRDGAQRDSAAGPVMHGSEVEQAFTPVPPEQAAQHFASK